MHKQWIRDGLSEYLSDAHAVWHMPGHKRKACYGNFQDAFLAWDVTEVPGTDDLYLPEGFMQTEFYQGNNPLSYTAVYEHGGDTIVIQIVKTTNQMGREFQKEAEQPEVYVQNGTYLAVWTDDGLECSITGVPTLDEMYKMIDSIY